ncbi:unnamed protein product [Lupinus luteus]|uniref:Protein TIC 214 n=1 Tax=Lupinus luteus TaxID=3873 RepID=A0AAV1VWY3_LUPLU
MIWWKTFLSTHLRSNKTRTRRQESISLPIFQTNECHIFLGNRHFIVITIANNQFRQEKRGRERKLSVTMESSQAQHLHVKREGRTHLSKTHKTSLNFSLESEKYIQENEEEDEGNLNRQ